MPPVAFMHIPALKYAYTSIWYVDVRVLKNVILSDSVPVKTLAPPDDFPVVMSTKGSILNAYR